MKNIFKKIGLILASIMMSMSLITITPVMAASETTLSASTGTSYDGEKIVNYARQWIGKIPYKWGGRNMSDPSTGLDCAGFVDFVFIKLGYTDLTAKLWGNTYNITDVGMTGTSWWDALLEQKNVTYAEGTVSSVSTGNAQPGDIVIYYDADGTSYHMGIYSGNGKLIHECEHLTIGDINNVTESDLSTCVSKQNVDLKSVRIYRVVNSDPEFASLSSTKTGTGKVDVNLSISKTDDETNKPLSNVEFEFHRVVDGKDEVIGTKKTDANGKASITSSISKEFTEKSSTYKYISDWKNVSDSVKNTWLSKGYEDGTTSDLKAVIQAKADKEAQEKVDADIKAYESQSITYYALETNAKTKYWLNPDNCKVTKTQNNSSDISWNMKNTRTKVTLDLVKNDKDTQSNRAQGDATLSGAVYGLYANKDILDPADDSVIYTKGTKILEVTTDNEGKAEAQNLYLGEYYWKEITAPEGYKVDNAKYVFDVEYTSQNVEIERETETIEEDVITGEFEITKVVTNGKQSEITKPEKNAVFGVVLKSFVDKYGSVEEALNHTDEMTEKEYEIMTTDENGHASSNELAYGKYVVQQLENGAEEVDILADSFEFEVTTVDQPMKYYTINNRPTPYEVLIEKQDFDTGKTVTLSSAKFQIKDSDGNIVTQSIAGKNYTTFVTNSDGKIGVLTQVSRSLLGKEWQSEEDAKGTVLTPLTLEAGTYTIDEIETPDGFLELEEPVEFTINKSFVSETTENGTPIVKVIVKNDQPIGKLVINKKIEDFDADTTFINREDLSGYEFTLYVKEDVISPIDGSVLYKANDIYGTYKTDENGNITVTDIPMGSYILKETSVLDGCILNEESKDVIFTQKDTVTKEYVVDQDITNKTTKLELSKKSVTGEDELEGAELEVRDEDGNVIDSWTSGKKTHIIEGLTAGKTYTLTETICPDGYVKATTIEFTIDATGEIQTVTMIDKVVTMSKQDVAGKELPGAKIQVFNEDGDIVDEWTSTTESHNIIGLEEGQTYTLHEDAAPAGYALATDIKFTVTTEKKDQTVIMTDKQVIVSKYDQLSAYVKGAKLQVLDSTGTVIVEWESDEDYTVEGLKVGETYVLHEVSVPKGYNKADNIEFTVEDDGNNQYIKMIDIKTDNVSITKYDATNKKELPGAKLKVTDSKGNIIDEWTSTKEAHNIDGLVIGDEYTLTEITAPNGYQKAESIKFTVQDNGTVVQKVNMYDNVIPTQKTKAPNTGVYDQMPIYLGTATVSGLAALLLLRKRKQH